ncbi:MAG: GNAT family N-acetyltransferase [Microthrixaceae bacterium]
MLTRETITVGKQRFRIGPWHADGAVAHLSLPPRSGTPSVDELRKALDVVVSRGYRSVLTSALESAETGPFLALGFHEHDRLQVLVHHLGLDGSMSKSPSGVRMRRGRRSDRSQALAVDAAAFPDFWRLDSDGLADAEAATPYARFRVATIAGRVVGYAVTGRGGESGFLQRLATEPSVQRRGVGSALVADSLSWCQRRRCTKVFVNTQVSNQGALALYRHLGFATTDGDLVVLRWTPP